MFENLGEIVVLVMAVVVTWTAARATAQRRTAPRHSGLARRRIAVDRRTGVVPTGDPRHSPAENRGEFDMIRIIEPRLAASA